ncbi:protein unc-45 homolog A [Neocloeon triangulifer]|uniref:protein unc-45 homolog A n=1 Tax=Neocloeon triangulifer TaxID=2078957 RepID=UPI00286EEB9F|nr:protein unc-45 homolog A [Neocloeon triangulifer]XP_059485605.1 protein unc-45 homolog A [Neocloeon triangulifer]
MKGDTNAIEEDVQKLKLEGNDAFKSSAWLQAVHCYTKALELHPVPDSARAILLKNRAAAYLKLEKYNKAEKDCDAAIEICPTDPKALFRRANALEALGRVEEAYRDATNAMKSDPTNKELQPLLSGLHLKVQEKIKEQAKTSVKVEQMMELSFDPSQDSEKRETAMKNLVVLAREKAGADLMCQQGLLSKLKTVLKLEKNQEICLAAIRTLSELCQLSEEKTITVLNDLGLPWFLDTFNSESEARVNAAQYCLQAIINSLSGLTNKPESKPIKEKCEANKAMIDSLLTFLTVSLTSRTITGQARDAIIELLTRNCHFSTLDWAEQFVSIGGLYKLLEVSSELQEYKYESAMPITENTKTLASVCLARIYENMYYDEARKRYFDRVEEFVKDKLMAPDIESKVRVTVTITTLLLGALDAGNAMIAKEGVMEMILVMANSEEELQQKVACECIIAAASKKDKVKSIISQGVHILKRLYNSKNDAIRIRALVGLCKLGSSGGTDASIRPFADGSTTKLAEACRRFLINPAKDTDIRRWAAEGLSYLTLDADVKEKLIEDRKALQALLDLAKSGSQGSIYAIVTVLVNLVNAYDKQEVLPEMLELAKFAKHHIPEEHELDDPDFVNKRIEVLAKEGVTSALVSLARTESYNCRELIGRVFNAICSQQEQRGRVSQQGGVKALLGLAVEGTDKGKRQAAQALARIGITINPEVAFQGQRCLEAIRPLVHLLHQDCTALENFEAMMALCNLAGVSEAVRKRIVKEQGVQNIEIYMYHEHQMLTRASVQCMVNLLLSPEVINMFEGENDRTKFLVLLCLDEDEETSKAAAGALAILLSASTKCADKVLKVSSWQESLRFLLANPNLEVQHRGLAIVFSLLASSKENATEIVGSDIFDLLLAHSQSDGDTKEKEKLKKIALDCLEQAEKWSLVAKAGSIENVPSDLPDLVE